MQIFLNVAVLTVHLGKCALSVSVRDEALDGEGVHRTSGSAIRPTTGATNRWPREDGKKRRELLERRLRLTAGAAAFHLLTAETGVDWMWLMVGSLFLAGRPGFCSGRSRVLLAGCKKE